MELSICIPTYNRSSYLKECLDSIAAQAVIIATKIEIVISDNNSSDDTETMVADFCSKNPFLNIVYSKNETNIGPDRNFLKVIELASGKYCWFIGSDDMIAPGSLERIICELASNHTIYLFNRTNCTKDGMVRIKDSMFLDKSLGDTVFCFNNDKDWAYFFNSCSSLGGCFSYISSIVFSREQWNLIPYPEEYIGTAYPHTAVLLQMLMVNGSSMKYLQDSLVLNRVGNDSFFKNVLQRFLLDYDG